MIYNNIWEEREKVLKQEFETLKKENFEIRKKLMRHNLTETLDIES